MLTDLFFTLNYVFSILFSAFSIFIGLIFILIFATNARCRSTTTLLSSNTVMTLVLYSLDNIIVSFYGFREDWAINQPLCRFRAYSFIVSCASICYGNTVQALGRLFITVFYKQKFLATYQVYVGLIVFDWSISLLLAVAPLFFDDAYIYEAESRLCTLSTKQFAASLYVIMTVFVFPVIVSMIIYGTIFQYAQSSPRTTGLISNPLNPTIPNLKREKIVARNMMIILMVFTGGGLPYLIVVLWHGISPDNPSPDSFYLLIVNVISSSVLVMVLVQFHTNKEIKDVALKYLLCKKGRVNQNPISPRQTIQESRL